MISKIFRAYDIRGIYPEELNEEAAFRIGQAAAVFLKAKKMVVGEDARISSPVISAKVKEGIASTGCNIISIGKATTPLFYFSVNGSDADGGIMVTASHNPPQYNGLKVAGREAEPISSNSGLLEIQKLAEAGVQVNGNKGSIKETSFREDYINFLTGSSKEISERAKDLKIVIDASNGMAPLILGDVCKRAGLDAVFLNFEIDGTFPGHFPDISKEENLKDLKDKMVEVGADIGFAFDGDADRLTVLDEKGNKVSADFVVGLFYQAKSGWFRKPKVAYDLRFSKSVRELFGRNGYPSRIGYAFVRKTMKDAGADFGGELAGHFDFKEMNYAESAVLAMLKVLAIVAREQKPLSKLVEPFQKYANSGEINIEVQNWEKVLENIKNGYKNGKVSELDGITVEYDDWWFNARPSNTEPILRLVVEADSRELMEEKIKDLRSLIGSDEVAKEYEQTIAIPEQKGKQFFLCPVGLVGAGKTTVLKPLAEKFGLVRISTDEIRKMLKERGYGYKAAESIALAVGEKYARQGYGIAIDADCARPDKKLEIEEVAKKLNVPLIWIHINPPEEFIINKLKNYPHTWLFKDAEHALQNYYARKPLHEKLDFDFTYTFDTSRSDIGKQIDEAAEKIKTKLGL